MINYARAAVNLLDCFLQLVLEMPGNALRAIIPFQMCVYAQERSQEPCQHHECSILATIRKLNKPIFKQRKKIEHEKPKEFMVNRVKISQKSQEFVKLQAERQREDMGFTPTLPSMAEIKLVRKVQRLEQEVKEIRELLYAMKGRLEYQNT